MASSVLHIDHIEDIILDTNRAIELLESIEKFIPVLGSSVSTPINMSVKVDGSPAIIFGINPDNNKFFIGTKSVFNKGTAKICYTKDEIYKHYKKTPILSDILEKCYVVLKRNWDKKTGIYQADFVFSDETIEFATINNEQYVTFTPNTITYAVLADSNMGNDIRSSRIGIAIHTKYSGKSFNTLQAKPTTESPFNNVDNDIWVFPLYISDLSGIASFTTKEMNGIYNIINDTRSSVLKITHIHQKSAETYRMKLIFPLVINKLIRSGIEITDETVIKEYIETYSHKFAEIDVRKKLKTAKENQTADNIRAQLLDIKNFDFLKLFVKVYINIIKIKNTLLKKINTRNDIKTFFKSDDSYDETAHEGFVIIDHLNNFVFKLVDRIEFSKQNFMFNMKA